MIRGRRVRNRASNRATSPIPRVPRHKSHTMAQAATRLSLAASGQSQQVEGDVRLTATPIFATYQLPPILARLREAAPGVRVEVVASNELRDLRRREADIAIRHVRPEEPTLMARRVGGTSAHLYATPAYLDRVGRPASMQDVGHLDFLGFESPTRMQQILLDFDVEIGTHQVPLCSTSGTVLLALMERHLGASFVTRDLADQRGTLEPVLPEMAPIEIPVWLVTHQELHTSARIRLVFDFLVQELSALPAAPSE